MGNAVYGLQSLEDSEETRKLVGALAVKVEQCTAKLSLRGASMAMYGVKAVKQFGCAQRLVGMLTRKVECSAALGSQASLDDVAALVQARFFTRTADTDYSTEYSQLTPAVSY